MVKDPSNSIAVLLRLKLKVDDQPKRPVANHEEDREGRKDPEIFRVPVTV